MFNVLEKIAQVDSKYQDVLLLENYAAFQNRYVSFIEVWKCLNLLDIPEREIHILVQAFSSFLIVFSVSWYTIHLAGFN